MYESLLAITDKGAELLIAQSNQLFQQLQQKDREIESLKAQLQAAEAQLLPLTEDPHDPGPPALG